MPSTAAKPPLSAATEALGSRVREARHALGLSQEQLAERTSLHWSYIGQVERGRNNVTFHNILRLAQVLQVDPGELIKGLTPPADVPTTSKRPRGPRPSQGQIKSSRRASAPGA